MAYSVNFTNSINKNPIVIDDNSRNTVDTSLTFIGRNEASYGQAIAENFGGQLYNQNKVKHGVSTMAKFDVGSRLFKNTAKSFKVGLYHSWAVKESYLPDCLKITARSAEDVIMAFEHKSLPIAGVQFHPESILSQNGKQIVQNFLFDFH